MDNSQYQTPVPQQAPAQQDAAKPLPLITQDQMKRLRAPLADGTRLTDDDIIAQMRRKPEKFGEFLSKYDTAVKNNSSTQPKCFFVFVCFS